MVLDICYQGIILMFLILGVIQTSIDNIYAELIVHHICCAEVTLSIFLSVCACNNFVYKNLYLHVSLAG